MTIATRLDQAMTAAGIPSQSALSRASAVPQPTINRILKGVGKGQPEVGTVRKLAKACNVSFNWLNEGIGDMARTESEPEGDTAGSPDVGGFKTSFVREHQSGSGESFAIRSVKLKLSAGLSGFGVDPNEGESGYPVILPKHWFDQHGFQPEDLVAVQVRGDSMEPTMSHGDTVVMNHKNVKLRDNKIYAVNYDGEAVIKRIVSDFGRWFLSSDNPDQRKYPRQECTGASCIVVGQIVYIQRSVV